jgi:protease PrsW
MLLLAMAIAPGIAICLYIFFKDQYNREPRKHLIISFLLGILSALFALILQLIILPAHRQLTGGSIFSLAIMAYLIVALSEEWSKYLVLRYYAYPKPEFDEPFDGIVYSVMVGMGFATIENIVYVMEHGLTTALVRMFLSVPAHATFAVLMGYSLGKAKFNPGRRFYFCMRGLLLAIFFHGTFDFLLFLEENQEIKKYIVQGLFFIGAIISFGIAIGLSRKAIREHIALSKQMHEDITI